MAAALAGLALLVAGCEGTPQERITEIYEWKQAATPESLERIRERLRDQNADVRATAVFVLTEKDPEGARAPALAALEDDDGFVRATAARCLGDLADPAFVPVLARHVLEDADWHVRQRAVEALAAIGGPEAAAAVLPALEDPVSEVRLAAVKGTADLDPALAVTRLASIVTDDPEWEIRVQAAGALGRTASPDALGALEVAARDENEFVRAAATRALNEVVGRIEDEPLEKRAEPTPGGGAAPEGSPG